MAQEKLSQGAVTGADIENSNGKLLVVGNRLRQDVERFLPSFLFLILACGPIGDVLWRIPIVVIVTVLV